ncbi:MAG: DoxX family protein [Acidimicrobiales bacterium]
MSELDAYNLGLLILRVGVGLTLASHGYNKFFGGGRIPGTARWFDSMGMRPGKLHATLAASTECAAGVGLALGLLTPLCGAAFVGLMFVAFWTVHRPNGFFIVKSGWEYNFILALVGVAVATVGPGEWSLDDKLGIGGNGLVGLVLSVGGGLAAGAAQLAAFYRPPATTES